MDKPKGYLASAKWAKIKADLFMVRGHKCERCNRTRGLQVHHLCYDRYGGDEEPDDLIILCAYHHQLEHNHVPMARKDRKRIKALKRFRAELNSQKKYKPQKIRIREKWQADQKKMSSKVRIIMKDGKII
jgi:5-methylcytosine-specific restriction endonuclease McrA